MDGQTPNTVGMIVEPTDSGPGPMDVLEARITLETRRLMDDQLEAVDRLRELLNVSPASSPTHIARRAHIIAEQIVLADAQLSVLRRMTGNLW